MNRHVKTTDSEEHLIVTVQQHILREQRKCFSAGHRSLFLAALRYHLGHEDDSGQGAPRGAAGRVR